MRLRAGGGCEGSDGGRGDKAPFSDGRLGLAILVTSLSCIGGIVSRRRLPAQVSTVVWDRATRKLPMA
jgi:hypothetical protein